MGPPPTAGRFLTPEMAGEDVAIAAFHALPTGTNAFGVPLAHAPAAFFATGAGSCLSETHSREPTTKGKRQFRNAIGKGPSRAYLVQGQSVTRGEVALQCLEGACTWDDWSGPRWARHKNGFQGKEKR